MNNLQNDDSHAPMRNKRKGFDRDWLLKLVQSSSPSTTTHPRSSCPLHDKILATAPMIEQSDTAFRLLTRRYGANLTYTPMIHAHTFCKKAAYRNKMFHGALRQEDRPLMAQIAGSNAGVLLECAKLLEPYVDAIDINLGCPTLTAKRGRYGAYLLGSGDYVVQMVKHLVENLNVPVTCKVRLLPVGRRNDTGENDTGNEENDNLLAFKHATPPTFDLEASLELYQALIDAGASMLCVHGRTKDMKGRAVGAADWNAIRTVVEQFGTQIPILTNGNLACYQDVVRCLEYTGADGVMSSEAMLEYPPGLYLEPLGATHRPGPGRLVIAREYLERARQYPPHKGNGGTEMQCLQMHMQAFLHGEWSADSSENGKAEYGDNLQSSIMKAKSIDDMFRVLDQVEERHQQVRHKIDDEKLSWYYRHWEFPNGQ